ncbi:CLUMA_CG004044, isoform A [Clunio marinus]|uniref:CLUMA_CG004044, isoform A n=1 Tax=Clunio marinus TaxID=568069 RepID=A0A1J1HSG4_9DIPT|nr:CLUMA_CG004044, isoform A [Clunio marinus]
MTKRKKKFFSNNKRKEILLTRLKALLKLHLLLLMKIDRKNLLRTFEIIFEFYGDFYASTVAETLEVECKQKTKLFLVNKSISRKWTLVSHSWSQQTLKETCEGCEIIKLNMIDWNVKIT